MASNLDLQIPTNGQPTEALAARFESWRQIIKSLNVYFKEYASAQDDTARQHTRLGNAVNFPFFQLGTTDTASNAAPDSSGVGATDIPVQKIPPNAKVNDDPTRTMFLPCGSDSIADIPGTLKSFHSAQASAASASSKELTQVVIPQLEDLRQDLLSKVKEIKNLSSDFKNSVSKEQGSTTKGLSAYSSAIKALNGDPANLAAKNDPYLLKDSLDKQISRQVEEENYLLGAYLNLQGSGKELEIIVVEKIQQALKSFGKMAALDSKSLDALSTKILSGFTQNDSTFEWDNFVSKDPNFIHPATQPRSAKELEYPGMQSNLANEVRSGYLERRSKYLKSYSRAWYVLTPAFLHEFKSPDRQRDPNPVLSLSLSDCQITRDKKDSGSSSHKFILNARQSSSGGVSGKGHNWVFRAENKEKLDGWFKDLTALSQIKNPVDRANMYFPAEKPASSLDKTDVEPASTEDTAGGQPPSPTLSNSSEVTSLGEPFGAGEEESSPLTDNFAHVETRNDLPGKFPSDVSNKKDTGESHVFAFSIPEEHKTSTGDSAIDDNASVFSYDLKKETHSTLPDDKNFKPVNSDTPVHLERRLTQTNHKDELNFEGGIGVARGPDEPADGDHKSAVMRRRSSVASTKSVPRRGSTLSRRATGSFGITDDLKPLSSTTDQPQGLFFAGGLPETTSSGPSGKA